MKKVPKKHPTDKCYLAYVEGYLMCTFNHKKIGEPCLMDYKQQY